MTHRRFVVALVFGISAALAGPSTAAQPCRPHLIRADGVAASTLGANATDAEIIDVVAGLMSRRLRLPFQEPARAYICADQAALVAGLIRIGGAKSSEAWDVGPFASGVATPAGLFLQGDYLAQSSLVERVGVIAHELAHLSQQKLGELAWDDTPLWILEGHAEWVQFRVLELLGLRDFALSRVKVAVYLERSPVPVEAFPDLYALASRKLWTRSANQLGGAATYGQAFLAVDWLVERYGAKKLLQYLEHTPSDPRPRWSAAFPISYRDFVDEFQERLRRRTPAAFGIPAVSPSPSAP
jgi:hypothetical protein